MIILHSLNLSFKVTLFVDSVAPPTCVTVAGRFDRSLGGNTTTYPKDLTPTEFYNFDLISFAKTFLHAKSAI